ncbi:TonB-dependent receptor [Vibrio sp. 99-70-13A1]|uniref:TonB-dependent receptor domain-containing protein n=1 Tax=Vibrio sp. 99-70-13A1 TaxID=2607601 RepID=UPI001493BDED|nr:TonB-dependent receptor [Vibrio sp. 99-70-13A1]NOH97514.1 TonB-dependent receptor [Vibrio sp. 99-70-13A1]
MKISHISLAITTALAAGTAAAETNNPMLYLEKITVLGSRIMNESETTQSISILSDDQIRNDNAQSITDVFKNSPNIEVIGGPTSSVKSLSIRGLDQHHANVSIDGARQSYSHSKKGSWAIAPSFLKSATVTNGTSSGAAAGAIKLEFLSALDLLKTDQSFGGMVRSGYRTNNEQTNLSASLYGASDKFDWLFSVLDSTREPYSIGGGYSPNGEDRYYKTEGENQSYLFKSGYDLTDTQRLELSVYLDSSEWNQVRQDYGLNTRDYTNAVLAYSNNPFNNDWLDLHANAYINQVDNYTVEYTDISEAVASDIQDVTDDSYGFILTNNTLSNQLFEETLFHYGLSGHFTTHTGKINTLENGDWVDESAQSEPSAQSHLLATWLNAQMTIGNGLTVTPSIRYDEFYVESKNAEFEGEALLRDGRAENQWSTGIRVNQQFTDQLALFVAYDEALTAPQISQLFTSGRGFKPNPNLKSERSQNKEVGITFEKDSAFATNDGLLVKVNVFQNDIKDYIGTDYTDTNYKDGVKVNRDKIRLRGGELLTQYFYGNWDASAAYAMTVGEDTQTGLYLSDMPSDKFTFSLNNQISNEWLLGGTVTHALERHRVPTASIESGGELVPIPEDERQSVPSWTTVDLYAEYIPSNLKDMVLSMSVTNVFDEAYAIQNNSQADTKAEYYEEGRSLNIDLSYQF